MRVAAAMFTAGMTMTNSSPPSRLHRADSGCRKATDAAPWRLGGVPPAVRQMFKEMAGAQERLRGSRWSGRIRATQIRVIERQKLH
jgi:hypothetical protein